MWPFVRLKDIESTLVRADGIGQFTITGQPDRDPFIYGRLRDGEMFEPHILAVLRALLGPGETFIDVGANIGLFTLCAARLVQPGGQVVAIEPEPRNAALLRRNVRQNAAGNVRVVAVALSDSSGSACLGLSEANAGDNRLGSQEQTASVRVRTSRMDRLAIAGGGRLVLKLDVQGSEVAVLRGAALLLAGDRTVRALVEFWPFGLRDCGSSAEALIALLEGHFQHFWIVWSHCPPLPVTPAELRHMAATNLAPKTQMFADIVALRATDAPGLAAMRRLAKAN